MSRKDQRAKNLTWCSPVCWLFIAGSVLLFVTSLTQVGFYTNYDRHGISGFALLVTGFFGVFSGMLAWLANPVLYLTWLLMLMSWRLASLRLASLISAVLALGLSLTFLLHDNIGESMDLNLFGPPGPPPLVKITGYGPGYWLWVGSIVTIVIGSFVTMLIAPAQATKNTHSNTSRDASQSSDR